MTFLRSRDYRSKSRIEIVLHLGAHKTATTYLQACLTRSVSPLLEKGVLFVPLGNLRKSSNHVSSIWNPLDILFGVRDRRKAGVYRKYLQETEIAECRRLVISEENLLGGINHVVYSGILYPEIEKKLAPVFRGLKGNPVTTLLAVRSYDNWIAGMWSQFIRKKGYSKMDERVKNRLLATSRGWVDVIDEIIRVIPPGSKLRVWRYEDLSKLRNEIIALFVGAENVSCVELIHQTFLPSLSARAMERLEKLHAQGKPTGPSDVKRVGKFFSKDKGFKIYSPWTDEEKAFLVKRYEQDMARIQERWPELMILAPSDACHM